MIEIRSYRRVFDLERRIYRIDRLRLNPAGVPVRGIMYFAAALVACLLSARLPLLASLSRVLPWYLRDLAVPLLSAAVLGAVRIEGRTFHRAAAALVRQQIAPRELLGGDRRRRAGPTGWLPPPLTLLPDGGEATARRMLYTGPGVVRVSVASRRTGASRRSSRSSMALRPTGRIGGQGSTGEVIVLAPGSRLLVLAEGRPQS